MPIVEAYYVGKPTVAFNICSHPEVVRKGILVEPKNINKFAEAIKSILNKSLKNKPN